MMKITNLVKTADTTPPEFTLVLKNSENTKRSYIHTTRRGTESQIRELLRRGGSSDSGINAAFNKARIG